MKAAPERAHAGAAMPIRQVAALQAAVLAATATLPLNAPPAARRRRMAGPVRANGFAMVTVVFVLVALAGIIAAVSGLLTRGAQATALDVRQARATEAARTALQWAAWQVRDPRGTLVPGATALPLCFTSPTTLSLPAPLADYTVNVACTRTPDATASPNYYTEDQRRLAMFVLTATVSAGAADSPERVERRLEMRVESCKDPAGALPDYAC